MYVVIRDPVFPPASVSHDPFVDEGLTAPLVPLLETARGEAVALGRGAAPDPLAARAPSPLPDILAPRLRFGRCPEEVEEGVSKEG